jgi:chemotaxis protein methyltransferase CheR
MLNTMSEKRLSPPPYGSLPAIPAGEARAFEYLQDWVATFLGLHFAANKHVSLYRRLSGLCIKLGLSDLNDMAQHLKAADLPNLPAELARSTSTNHSFFFREPEVLRFFRERIIPSLPEGERWRLWSAAAAGGEEAYTLAILLSEVLSLPVALQQAAILGTDISYPMIEHAEHGVYAAQKLELVDEPLRRRYFQPAGAGQWQVQPNLKPMCTFRRMNLNSRPWPFQQLFHVVFCRNVLYYFHTSTQLELVERLYDLVAPGGWLVTSVTETLHGMPTRWRPVMTGIYWKG